MATNPTVSFQLKREQVGAEVALELPSQWSRRHLLYESDWGPCRLLGPANHGGGQYFQLQRGDSDEQEGGDGGSSSR